MSVARALPLSADADSSLARLISQAAVASLGGLHLELPLVGFAHPQRLRVAYMGALSGRGGLLVAGLLEAHRRIGKVDASAVVVGRAPEGSEAAESLRSRGQLTELHGRGATEAAQSLNSEGGGYHVIISVVAWGVCPAVRVLALSPAPLQVAWVQGSKGTTGAPFVQGLITDSVSSPPEYMLGYAEGLLALPFRSSLLAGPGGWCPPAGGEAGVVGSFGFWGESPPSPRELLGFKKVSKALEVLLWVPRYADEVEDAVRTAWKRAGGHRRGLGASNSSWGGCVEEGVALLLPGAEHRASDGESVLAGLRAGVPTVSYAMGERPGERAAVGAAASGLFAARGWDDALEVAIRLLRSRQGREAVERARERIRAEVGACGKGACGVAMFDYDVYAAGIEQVLRLAVDADGAETDLMRGIVASSGR